KYDINLLGRMYYNLANVYYRLDYYDKALEVCEIGIKTCLQERSFAVVADLFMCKGSILADQGLMEEATTCAKFFVTLYEMQGKRNQIERVIEQYKALGIDIA
ncbi:XRE family transcriptional regulator, partial [Turicibacter sanguinis]|nr:XRE family transcriptional regulator [Turicibacter sanguinis]